MLLSERVGSNRSRLTRAERRVADVVLRSPEQVAFGTVAEVAAAAGTGGATVVRCTTKLGFGGFSDLQEAVRAELAERLRPAAERIRAGGGTDLLGRARTAALDAVAGTFDGLDPAAVDRAVTLLSDIGRRVRVVAGDAGRGVAAAAAQSLAMLRPGVEVLEGNEVAVHRRLASGAAGDVVVAVDLRRYDAWVLGVVEAARQAEMLVIAVSDGPLSPLAHDAEVVLGVRADGVGPFDSYLGVLTVLETLTVAVADRNRAVATERLDRIEAGWRARRLLHEPDA